MAVSGATEPLERGAQLVRGFATAGVALVFAVIVASAYLRLVQSGLGCADWPACYGAAPSLAIPVAEPPLLVGVMRAMHRIAAAAVGLIVIVITVMCFGASRQSFRRKLVAGLLLGLTLFLALLGTVTPGAQLPAVTLGNLLGGMTMLGLFWWLRLEAVSLPPAPRAPFPAPWTWFGLALLAIQIALGGLISARFAALACMTFPDCDGAWWPHGATFAAFGLFNPAGPPAMSDPAGATLHMVHRYGALLVAAYLAALATRAYTADTALRKCGVAILALVVLQVALGVTAVLMSLPLALVVAHNAGAALLLLGVTHLAQRAQSASPVS